MSIHNIQLFNRKLKTCQNHPHLSPGLVLWSARSGLNYQVRTNYHGPKDVRAIAISLYMTT